MRLSTMLWPLLAAAAMLWLVATNAAAAPQPMLLPAYDMVGVYRVTPSGRASTTWRVQYSAELKRVRMTSLGDGALGAVILLDLRRLTAEMIIPQMHAVVSIPEIAVAMHHALAGNRLRFTALGHRMIAGHHCTRYLVLRRSAEGTACLTRDGVLLGGEGTDAQGSVRVVALHVREAVQPPNLFRLPSGYSRINLPPELFAQLMD